MALSPWPLQVLNLDFFRTELPETVFAETVS